MAVSKQDYIIPSIALNEVYYLQKSDPIFMANKIEHVIQDGFFKSVEIAPIEDKAARQRIAKSLSIQGCKIKSLVVWLTGWQMEQNVNINDIDEKKRQQAVSLIKVQLDYAKECGANLVGVCAGEDVSVLKRSQAFAALIKSIEEIAQYAQTLGLGVMIEPHDLFVNSKRLLGSSRDAEEIMGIVAKEHQNVSIAMSTAHTALNREGLNESLEMIGKYISHIHFSNAVLDRSNPLYGDKHLLLGTPGSFLNVFKATRLLSNAWKNGLCADKGITVAVVSRQEEIANHDLSFISCCDGLKQIMFEFALHK